MPQVRETTTAGRLRDSVVVVTGGASGIGRASAALYAREGAQVVVADISPEGARIAEAIAAQGGRASFQPIDVTSAESVAGAFSAIVERHGRVDVLHNNAGGSSGRDGSLTDAPVEEFWRVVELDLLGTILCCRSAIPIMKAGAGGSIINMTSVVSLIGVPNVDFYTAAKGGVASLTRTLAVQHAPSGIRVNALAPGVTATERIRALSGGDFSRFPLMRKQVGGVAEADDVAAAALFLASGESRAVTGVILPVDGGAQAW